MSESPVCPKCGHVFKDGDVQVVELKSASGTNVQAYCCPNCHSVLTFVPER